MACNDLKNEDDIDCKVLYQRMGQETSSQWLPPNFVLVLKVWDMMHVVKIFNCIKKFF